METKKERVKVGNAYSSWKDIFYGIPRGSILGPLVLNILLYDLICAFKRVALVSYKTNFFLNCLASTT